MIVLLLCRLVATSALRGCCQAEERLRHEDVHAALHRGSSLGTQRVGIRWSKPSARLAVQATRFRLSRRRSEQVHIESPLKPAHLRMGAKQNIVSAETQRTAQFEAPSSKCQDLECNAGVILAILGFDVFFACQIATAGLNRLNTQQRAQFRRSL